MFGYVRYDMPNLYVKDLTLYKAMYCGLCKGIGEACGQLSRMGLTYDMTFFSILVHNLSGTDVTIERSHCVEHTVKKRPIARVDELTKQVGALNTIFLYYKLTDDIADGDRGRGRRLWFKGGFRRAKKAYPKLCSLVESYMREQEKAEKQKISSPDMAADPTASLLRELSDYFLKEKSTEYTRNMFYELGKWIYLIDAFDDYEKDRKKGRYNPFVITYGGKERKDLTKAETDEVAFLFDALFYSLRENMANVTFYFNRDLTDNVLLRGLPLETERVLKGEPPAPMQNQI